MADLAGTRYRTAPGVSWAVVQGGVLVIGGAPLLSHLLPYPEAAIWDMLGRGRSVEHVARLLPLIGRMSEEDAERLIKDSLRRWSELGLVEPSDEADDG